MRANSDNLVLLPEFVDRYVEHVSVEYIRVDAVSGDLKYDITTLDVADTFAADGAIEWKGGVPGWVVPRGGSISLNVEGGVWVARNGEGELMEAQPPAAAAGVDTEPLSRLYSLFKSDFPNLFKTQSETTLRGTNGNDIIDESGEYLRHSDLPRQIDR